jgi:hypothetical protein
LNKTDSGKFSKQKTSGKLNDVPSPGKEQITSSAKTIELSGMVQTPNTTKQVPRPINPPISGSNITPSSLIQLEFQTSPTPAGKVISGPAYTGSTSQTSIPNTLSSNRPSLSQTKSSTTPTTVAPRPNAASIISNAQTSGVSSVPSLGNSNHVGNMPHSTTGIPTFNKQHFFGPQYQTPNLVSQSTNSNSRHVISGSPPGNAIINNVQVSAIPVSVPSLLGPNPNNLAIPGPTANNFQVKETNAIKRNHASLPSTLIHAQPTTGDWLNKRYIINNYILLDVLGQGSYAEVCFLNL